MIKQLSIKNFILIDNLSIKFDSALNVITGETGAGKSILINAIDIAFGAKASKDLIKTGKEKATIELILENKHDLKNLFEEHGIENFGDEIILSKEISTSSARSRVNGTLVNQEFIKKLKEYFLDIHSQHQTYAFLQPKYHIELLDNFAKNYYGNLLDDYKKSYTKYLDSIKKLEELKNTESLTQSQLDFLKFQINEIVSADIKSENEDEALQSELNLLENSEKLKESTSQAYAIINNDDVSILSMLFELKNNLAKASSIDETLKDTESSLLDAIEIIKDTGSTLRNYSSDLNYDEEHLNFIQERLFYLDKLKRKYGGTLSSVLSHLEKFEAQLSSIEHCENNIEELTNKIEIQKQSLKKIAKEISDNRKTYAEALSSLITEKLIRLELPKAQFKIAVQDTELNSKGADNVEFLISTNVSEPLKQLDKVASGGEISRIMLAIKSIFAQSDEIDTVIFDEIDTGISGKTSQSVAEEISELSKYHQIILITHQAIIASKASNHLYVRKSHAKSTSISVKSLNAEEKLSALAELASGDINEKSLDFARSLLG